MSELISEQEKAAVVVMAGGNIVSEHQATKYNFDARELESRFSIKLRNWKVFEST